MPVRAGRGWRRPALVVWLRPAKLGYAALALALLCGLGALAGGASIVSYTD